MNRKENQKNKKGISLIVLVITIIVIIILSVAVILSISNNNPIENARKARFQSDLKTIKEEITLYVGKKYADLNGNYSIEDCDFIGDAMLNEFTSISEEYKEKIKIEDGKVKLIGEKITDQEKNWAKEIGIEVTEKSEIEVGVKAEGTKKTYIDVDGDKAIIPINFAIVPGCDNVSEGLVISDVENDTANSGNQFVWIPVEDFSTFKREDGYFDGEIGTEVSSGETTEPYTYAGVTTNIIEEKDFEAMRNSVRDNKGFYIGRYEASNNGGVAESKKNKISWVSIKWGNTMTDITGGAVEKARLVYPESTTKQSGEVVSTLCYGVQWDAIMRWFKKSYPNIVKDSDGFGNYDIAGVTTNKINTGSEDAYKVKNIYDICGNVWEWTMEAYSNDMRIYRGGVYNSSSASLPVSSRSSDNPNGSGQDVGFRIALYIK